MIQASQLRSGMCILFEGDVCRVMTAQHVTPGNLGTKILIDTPRKNRYLKPRVSPDQLIEGLTWFVVFIFSTTLHEAGHAFAAWKLGDSTAYEGGQVSLNPLPHIQREPIGMVLVPIISFALNGWMMGWASAPYDPEWAHRYPKRAAIMAAAGPAGNLLLALLSGIVIRLVGTPEGGLGMTLLILFYLNLVLFVFNLLPVPPLDGSAILPMFMSDDLSRRYRDFLHQPMFSLLGLLLAWKVFPYLFDPIQNVAFRLLAPG